MASVFKRGKKKRGDSWYISWYDHEGQRHTKSAKTTDKATVMVTGGHIESVLRGDRDIDAALEIDAGGKTIMPGLIDTHVHLFSGLKGRGEQAFRDELREDIPLILKEYLRHGVTTIKSTGDPLPLILELRHSLRQRLVPGPRLLAVGPGFTAPGIGGRAWFFVFDL